MKKFIGLAVVLVMVIAMAVPALATGASIFSVADEWFADVSEAGTLTVADNKENFEFSFEDAGTFSIGLQRDYTGQLQLVDFVPAGGDDDVESPLFWDDFWAARWAVIEITHLYYGQEDPRKGCEGLDALYVALQKVENYLWCIVWRPDLATEDQKSIDYWLEFMINALAAYNAHVEDCNCFEEDIPAVTLWTITFDTAGGTLVDAVVVPAGTSFNAIVSEIDNPTQTGYNFVGWKFISGTLLSSGDYFVGYHNTLVAMWEKEELPVVPRGDVTPLNDAAGLDFTISSNGSNATITLYQHYSDGSVVPTGEVTVGRNGGNSYTTMVGGVLIRVTVSQNGNNPITGIAIVR